MRISLQFADFRRLLIESHQNMNYRPIYHLKKRPASLTCSKPSTNTVSVIFSFASFSRLITCITAALFLNLITTSNAGSGKFEIGLGILPMPHIIMGIDQERLCLQYNAECGYFMSHINNWCWVENIHVQNDWMWPRIMRLFSRNAARVYPPSQTVMIKGYRCN